MGVAATREGAARAVEIRIRFEPGLGAALYASLREGEEAPVTVARMLGRGRALLQYHGVTLMAHGVPDWTPGESFRVYVKDLGPPLVLAPVGSAKTNPSRITYVDSAVVPGTVRESGIGPRG